MTRAIAGLLALLGATLVSACDLTEQDTLAYHYRLKVEVETPEGLKTGSSVIRVETKVNTRRYSARAHGEAVAIDMPDGRTLFALLRSENEVDWASGILFLLGPRYRGEDSIEQTVRAIARNRLEQVLPFSKSVGNGTLRRDGYPMLVTFGDLDDPTSVERVDPLDLEATFGDGVRLKRITVQVTDDPVTTGIEERLDWLSDPEVMDRPGWKTLPREVREVLVGLRASVVGSGK